MVRTYGQNAGKKNDKINMEPRRAFLTFHDQIGGYFLRKESRSRQAYNDLDVWHFILCPLAVGATWFKSLKITILYLHELDIL